MGCGLSGLSLHWWDRIRALVNAYEALDAWYHGTFDAYVASFLEVILP